VAGVVVILVAVAAYYIVSTPGGGFSNSIQDIKNKIGQLWNTIQHLKEYYADAIASGNEVLADSLYAGISALWAEIDQLLCELWDALHPGDGRAQFTLYLPFHDFSNIESLLPLLQ